jgi:hypothetical protein
MRRLMHIVFVFAFALLGASASAQDTGGAVPDLFAPGFAAPKQDFGLPEGIAGSPIPYLPGPAVTVPSAEQHRLRLEARLVDGGPALESGVSWRVFSTEPGAEGHLQVLATETGGSASVQLAPGSYMINAAFGRASATKRVTIGDGDQVESVVLNAGGLRLSAVVGEGRPVPADKVTFEISQDSEGGPNAIIVPHATGDRILRLGAGTYHVVSRYGTVNAVVRADIEVEAGKLTEAVIRHAGAEATLKLVSNEGGEALANTVWNVLTEGGDTVHESVGAFPSIILAEGKYTAVASHERKAYSRDFTIEAGVDRDVEVLLSDLVVPEAETQRRMGGPN